MLFFRVSNEINVYEFLDFDVLRNDILDNGGEEIRGVLSLRHHA